MSACSTTMRPGDGVTLAVVNGRVWTGNPRQPWAEAVAVRGHEIALVGSRAAVLEACDGATRMVDARGGMVCPGFIDAHVHLMEAGYHLASVQLRDAGTPGEFTRRIGRFASGVAPGAWITGGDWDHERWGGELPRRDWIDAVTPGHPVFVTRLDGHMGLANSRALQLAGITSETAEVDGGTIVRGPGGEPTGILKDNAMALVQRVIPEPPAELADQALEAAMLHLSERGVTTVQTMGGDGWSHVAVLERAHRARRLITRVRAAVPISTWKRLRERVTRQGRGDRWLRVQGLKGFVDGSLGSHTAAFHEPYTDTPGKRGLLVNDPAQLESWIKDADRAGLQVMVHAIGDRAITLLLDIYARTARNNGPRERRFRIEHAQHIAARDLERFAPLGVIASMQPYHAIDDGRWAEKVIGRERCRTTYAFRSLLDAGASLAFGSDWFVAPPTPLEGIHAAVTRRTLDGKHPEGWVPEQKITVEEALRAYTLGAARASFDEERLGSLEPGKLADVVVIDRDLTRIPPEEIRDARVLVTIVDGRVVFSQTEESR